MRKEENQLETNHDEFYKKKTVHVVVVNRVTNLLCTWERSI